MRLAHVTFTVRPEDRRTALDILLAEVPLARAMIGCRAFIPFVDPTADGALGILHEWESQEHFAAYLASDRFSAVGARLRPLMTQPPVSRRFDAKLAETVE